jgi:hypothetical protein
VVVEIPTFRQIEAANDDEEEDASSSSSSSSSSASEEEEVEEVQCYDPPCEACAKAKSNRVCVRPAAGGACEFCKRNKHRCTYSKLPKRGRAEFEAGTQKSGDREESKKPAPARKSEAGPSRKRGVTAARPVQSSKKGKERAAPKSREYIEDSDEGMVVDDEVEQDEEEIPRRKSKRARTGIDPGK